VVLVSLSAGGLAGHRMGSLGVLTDFLLNSFALSLSLFTDRVPFPPNVAYRPSHPDFLHFSRETSHSGRYTRILSNRWLSFPI
jgi:hypothetical protein